MTHKRIFQLMAAKGYPCISIFIPTHRTIPERLKDPAHIKNLVGKAVDRLLEEFPKQEVLPYADALDALLSRLDYAQLLDGLAIFINKDITEFYILPFWVPEKVIVDDTFALKDIIKGINRSPPYWVLALSHKPTRLFIASQDYLSEIFDPLELRQKQEGFPFELNYEVTSDSKQMAVELGEKDARYFTDLDKRFFEGVDKALALSIAEHPFPVILLGVEKNIALFKEVTKHKDLIAAEARGDYSKANSKTIGEITWPLMQQFLKTEEKLLIDQLPEMINKTKLEFGFEKIWPLAVDGRIHQLIVEENFSLPGFINDVNQYEIALTKKTDAPAVSDDLVDRLIELVLQKRGRVIFVAKDALKDFKHIAAILRY